MIAHACMLAGALAATAHAADAAGIVAAAEAQDAVYRNALYLWLRAAGVVWIAVEWVAAIVVLRTLHLLRRHLDGGGTAP